jgi:hypothetical protein
VLRMQLTATEQAALAHTCKTTPDRRLRDRCQAVLLTSRGRKREAGIAPPYACGAHSRIHPGCGLQDSVGAGATGPPARAVGPAAPGGKDGPQRCGLARAHWTYAARAASLSHTPGSEGKRTAMWACCRAIAYGRTGRPRTIAGETSGAAGCPRRTGRVHTQPRAGRAGC